MKNAFLFFLLNSFITFSQIPQNQWVWIGGDKVKETDIYELGLNSSIDNDFNLPGFRQSDLSVTDSNGNIWFFSGDNGYSSDFLSSALWKYNTSLNNFSYLKGIFHGFSKGYSQVLGEEHYRNQPPTSSKRQIWIDNSNNIYVFSGTNVYADLGPKSDFWKYNKDTNNWTLIDEGEINFSGNYGVIGLESVNNKPPSTYGAITWTDNQNNLWMFGGIIGIDENLNKIRSNSLWKYNLTTSQWTWMSGSNLPNQEDSFGEIGVESELSVPGYSIGNRGGWKDNNGFLWLFDKNNIWKYNINTNLWTLVKQATNVDEFEEVIVTEGTEHIDNFPLLYNPINDLNDDLFFSGNGRVFFRDDTGNLWYYYHSNSFDKLWRYNVQSNMWTLIKKTSNSSGNPIGNFNVSDLNNTPGHRTYSITGCKNGKLYMISGQSSGGNMYKDLWEYNIETNIWTWINGYDINDASVESFQRVRINSIIENENSPGFMTDYVGKWEYQGNLYLYGNKGVKTSWGYNYAIGDVGEVSKTLWKYHSNINKWEVIHTFEDRGNGLPLWEPVFNLINVESDYNSPNVSRQKSMSFSNNSASLFLFGGSDNWYRNDMWRFNLDTKKWVWIGGSNQYNVKGDYGTQGVFNETNMPGARVSGKTWCDPQGNLWLFGGNGFDSVNENNLALAGNLNDVWKYDINLKQWSWIRGSNLKNQPEFSAGLHVTSPNNSPSFIENSVHWQDNEHNMWLYTNGAMWKFDINTTYWTKVKNSATINLGLLNIESPSNNPGNLYRGATWIDEDGNLLYFDIALWKFNRQTFNWTWIGGRKFNPNLSFPELHYKSNYGQMNQSFISNLPGRRNKSVSWKDFDGNFFLFGGNGWDEESEGGLSDLWKMNRKFNIISGNIKFDINNNNNCTSSVIDVVEAKINITDGNTSSFVFSNNVGNYSVLAQNSNVSITPQLNFYNFAPNTQNFNFSGFGVSQIQNFCASATGLYNDLEIVIMPLTDAIPGFNSKYKIIYKNKGTTTLSGNIAFNYSDNVMDFISSNSSPNNQSNGIINWTFNDLVPFEKRTIELTFNLNSPTQNPPLNANDVLNFNVSINSNEIDETPTDNIFNLNQTVVNSFDPNDKTCLNGDVVSTASIGDYVYYKIRFENTGSANAQFVIITDYIDLSKFDIESIIPFDASHDYRMIVSGNKVDFIFDYINLPFPPSELRHGFVVFKIKIKSSLNLGDTFSNSAEIYFDYNYPILTNNFTTLIENDLNVNFENKVNEIILYPNPVSDILYINTEQIILKIEVYDIAGRLLFIKPITDNIADIKNIKTGNYILKLYTTDKVYSKKIIKKYRFANSIFIKWRV